MKSNYTKLSLLGLIMLFLFSGNVYSQEENVVTGKVFPVGMQTPMSGVSVQIEGNDASTVITDGTGFFKLEVSSFPVNLVFIKEYYGKQVVTVKKASDISIYLSAAKEKNAYGQEVGMRVSLNPESRDGILMFSSTDKQLKVILSNGSGWSYSSTYIDIDSIQMISKEEAFIWINGSKMKIYADLIKPAK